MAKYDILIETKTTSFLSKTVENNENQNIFITSLIKSLFETNQAKTLLVEITSNDNSISFCEFDFEKDNINDISFSSEDGIGWNNGYMIPIHSFFFSEFWYEESDVLFDNDEQIHKLLIEFYETDDLLKRNNIKKTLDNVFDIRDDEFELLPLF